MEAYRTDSYKTDLAVSAYIRQVYLWMTIGLALTGVTAYYTAGSEQMVQFIFGKTWVLIGLIIVEFVLVIALSAAINKMSPFVATAAFALYAVISGMTLASIFIVYPIGTISNAFFVTAATFMVMSIYGTATKRDLTGLGSFLMMGLIGIIIASIVNFFLKSTMMDFVISCIGVLVFTGLTAYDTQKLRRIGAQTDMSDSGVMRRFAIIGALTLYLDFINLFLMILRLMGGRKD